MTTAERVLPHHLDAERDVIGSVMLNNALFWEIRYLSATDFFREPHRKIWTAIVRLMEEQQPIDLRTLVEQLRQGGQLEDVGGQGYIASLIDGVPHSSNVESYARMVRRKARLRAQIAAASQMLDAAYADEDDPDEILDDAQRTILSLTESGRERPGLVPATTMVAEVLPVIERILEAKSPIVGLKTGFLDLDSMTRGLPPGELVLVGARPSMGKTAFAGNVAEQVAVAGGTVALFSLEMTRAQLTTRMLAAYARIDLHKMLSGWISQREYELLSDAIAAVGDLSIHVDDWARPSLLDLRAGCRKLRMQRGLSLVIVDYLQLMPVSSHAENRNIAIGEISRGLKALAKELEVPVIALSQLSRDLERRPNKRPNLSDLRESGNLEQDADQVWFLYRDEVYDEQTDSPGIAELIVAKARNGPTGTVKLRFNQAATRFENLSRERE